MDLPLLLLSPSVPSSSSFSHRLLISQFNSNPLHFVVVRNSVSEAIEPDNSMNSAIFRGKKQLPGPQALIDGLSPPVRLATSAVVVAGALAAGYGLGFRFGGTWAVALGAAGGAAVYAMIACVPEVAAVSLHNYVVGS